MPKEGEEEMTPLGHIPQVERTLSYLDQDFGLINEAQLTIAESTIAAKTVGWAVSESYGYNMMCMEELTKIAMERCTTARCAVQTMGDLAVEYGYFSLASGTPDKPGYGGSAEAAAVGDGQGEVWMFHVMTGPNNASAVWAAQRVPDGHVSVMANAMIIRHMDLDDPDNFLASDNVHSFAIDQGWWDPEEGPFDFTATYAMDTSCSNTEWEFPLNALYAGRRMWRVYDLLSPSANLDSTLGWIPKLPTYPFSMEPERKGLLPSDLMVILRDNYEGTPYDLAAGIKGGPFSSPLQYDPGHDPHYPALGGWERSIASYRMLFSFVAVSRPWLPPHIGGMVWYGQARSTSTVYVPFYAGHQQLPQSYVSGLESSFSFDTAWWAFSFVQNLAQIKWNVMFEDISAEQQRLEAETIASLPKLEAQALVVAGSDGTEASVAYLQAACNWRAAEVLASWWELAWRLVSTYSNGFITHGEAATRDRPGYPLWWLKTAGYEGWPHGTFTDPRSEDWCGGNPVIHPLTAAQPPAEPFQASMEAEEATEDEEEPAADWETGPEEASGSSSGLGGASSLPGGPVASTVDPAVAVMVGLALLVGSLVGFAVGKWQQSPAADNVPDYRHTLL
mmetsp:Transcript_30199/g.85306  ORF Transcript_30199/g.85306 Transcript_30199/m.85306 type:complete len:618 (+) Transcript_30199:584-2437(+)